MVASGEGLTYQWFGPGGVLLSNMPGEIAGVNTDTLQIFNIQSDDVGSYRVQVSNSGGSVNSDSVNLTIGKSTCFWWMPTIYKLLIKYHFSSSTSN